MKHARDEVLHFLADCATTGKTIPSIPELGQELGISTASVREQLEVARCIGIVDIKPRTGIQSKEFSLSQSTTLAMVYGVNVKPELFEQYASMRQQLEMGYWNEAVSLLTKDDIFRLKHLVDLAYSKIMKRPLIIPNDEHREFHLAIYRPLKNEVLNGILETYWDLHNSLNVSYYQDEAYLQNVWDYHRKMVEAIEAREYEKGYNALTIHLQLLKSGKKAELKQRFE